MITGEFPKKGMVTHSLGLYTIRTDKISEHGRTVVGGE